MNFLTWLKDLIQPGTDLSITGATQEVARWYWTQGAVWGVFAMCVFYFLALPKIKKWWGDRSWRFEAPIRSEGRRMCAAMRKGGTFEGPHPKTLGDAERNNPYEPKDKRHQLWNDGFMDPEV